MSEISWVGVADKRELEEEADRLRARVTAIEELVRDGLKIFGNPILDDCTPPTGDITEWQILVDQTERWLARARAAFGEEA